MRTMLVMACVLALAVAAVGCGGANVKYTQVELRGVIEKQNVPKDDGSGEFQVFLTRGETALIKDPRIAQKLASFFPGLGTGRKSFSGVHFEKSLELVFSNETGQRITVYTKWCEYWGSDVDRGDLNVSGDLRSYLEALLYTVEVRKAASAQ
jgi:hypothetical protein